MITHELDAAAGNLKVKLPADVLSTNSDALRKEIFGVLESDSVKITPWNKLNLDLTAAKMVDSAGLNLLVSIINWVKNRNAKVGVAISSANIHRTFLFTRLDKQIELTKV